ncbi:MAG: hypothetical protein JO061_05870 [Acidobacteriaceae bacterium]|nr:hypothetical protein [Acidobacteriaceae bacterium]
MNNPTALRRLAAVLLFGAAILRPCLAVETQIWDQSEQADFTRGTSKHLSIRSDGRVNLAPEFTELDSTTVPYLWAIAQDSKGFIYYAGGAPTGATARIFQLKPGGHSKLFAEVPGLEIHALAVDAAGRVYAAVVPDAKIYRIGTDGKPQLFFDANCKYIWSMSFDSAGNLFVATGDSGVIYKVTPDGKGSEFAQTNETHARSMIIDAAGDLIVGTEPGGLVLRVTPQGETFVLYQTGKREVTAVAEHHGIIYAASVGNKTGAVSVTGPAPVLPSTAPPVTPTGAPRSGASPPSLGPAIGSLAAAVTGGSELYRIEQDGFAERIWQSSSDLVYAIAFDRDGRPLLGTGNKGVIYRVDSEQLSTELLNAPPTQVTAFLSSKSGTIYAVTGNVGNVYAIGPKLQSSGVLESDVLDANDFSYWGTAHITCDCPAGSIRLETRSGNLSNPQHDWSAWSPVVLSDLSGDVKAPPARFLQYRFTLTRNENGPSPVLSSVDIPFIAKNVAPRIRQIDIAPFNYRESSSVLTLERNSAASGSPTSISVPAVGQKRNAPSSSAAEAAPAATLQYSKGYLTVRWSASDQNNDSLIFKVELRNKKGTTWRLLKDKLLERFYSFDTTAFPDGDYIIRITASDAPDNTPAAALTSCMDSDPFTIDNTPPTITDVNVVRHGDRAAITFTATDALSWVDKAEYSLDGGDWTLIEPVSKVGGSQTVKYSFEVPADQAIAIRVFDDDDNVAVKQVQ